MIKGGGANIVTAGLVLLWDGASCPTGYTRLTALDNRFLQGNTTYNAAAGGASTHQHPSHSHGVGHDVSLATSSESNGVAQTGGPFQRIANPHNHGSVTASHGSTAVTVDAANNQPSYATFLICQKD